MLKTEKRAYHQVKNGQTLRQIADYYSVAEGLLIKLNRLEKPPVAGQILRIPKETGNVYFVREGDTKELLCGSEEAYQCKNGTGVFYIGMRVIL